MRQIDQCCKWFVVRELSREGTTPHESGTQHVLDSLEYGLMKEIDRVAPCYDSLKEWEKLRLRLWALIVKLGHRDRTLAKMLLLQNYYLFIEDLSSLESYQPKRGKKQHSVFPLKLIMKVLGCSHRTAVAYQQFQKGQELAEEFFRKLAGGDEPSHR
jgi:hypothetical protein